MKRGVLKKAGLLILCITLIFSNVQSNVIVDVEAAETTTENLLPNGYFEEGLSPWNAYFLESNSGSVQVTEDYFASYNIGFFMDWYNEWTGEWVPVTWSIMLENNNVWVQSGKKYKISFTAKSTVERPILVEFGGGGSKQNYFFTINSEPKEYTFEFNSNYDETVNFKFHMGPISEEEAGNTTGIGITNDNFVEHTINIGKVSVIDVTNGDATYVKFPSIMGIDDGVTYKTPISATVNYGGSYNISLTKDGESIDYTEGQLITEDGNYVITVTDNSNPLISTEKSFRINKDIDYTKTYYAIIAKKTDKAIEVQGGLSGNAVIQNKFTGSLGQFFTIEKVSGDYYAIRSLLSDNVVAVQDGGDKLIQTEYTGASTQQWKTVNCPQGYVKFENRGTGKVIDIPGGSKIDCLQLQQYTNSGTGDEGQNSNDAQRFDLVEIKNIKDYIEGKQINVSTDADWQQNAFITPIANDLNPAGPIAVEWYQAPGNPVSYDIYFNGELKKSVDATDEETMKVEDGDIYSTKVAKHNIKIVAKYGNGNTLETKLNEFYITKKGIGWGTLHRTTDMNLSWYYRWATDPAVGTDETLTFVPMIWSNYGQDWLADSANQKYGTVLSFNEPDWSDQSNVPVTKELAQAWVDRYNAANGTNDAPPKSVEEAWQGFMDSGLRVGSPATALAPPYCLGQITMNEIDGPDRWWADFEQLMEDNKDKGWDYDFVAIHSYNSEGNAESFLEMVKETHEMTGKPIWITEFGVADWNRSYWNEGTEGANESVVEFMKELLPELDKLEYVERYAWFPFDPNDEYGGSSGLFNYSNGELTELGKVYAMYGLPEGYTPSENYWDEISTDSVEIDGYQISYLNKGFRTVYSVEPEINGKAVEDVGLIYGLKDYVEKNEMYIGSESPYVKNYDAVIGKMQGHYGESATADTYVMTMKFASTTAKEFSTEYIIRAYAKLSDGTYVYSTVEEYTVYAIADLLYRGLKTVSEEAHMYLYDTILSKVNDTYKEIPFDFNNLIVKP